MKKIAVVLALCLFLSACAHAMIVGDQVYQPYGAFNMTAVKAPNIEYQPVWGNIAFGTGFLFFPPLGLIGTLYFWGFSAMEPTGIK